MQSSSAPGKPGTRRKGPMERSGRGCTISRDTPRPMKTTPARSPLRPPEDARSARSRAGSPRFAPVLSSPRLFAEAHHEKPSTSKPIESITSIQETGEIVKRRRSEGDVLRKPNPRWYGGGSGARSEVGMRTRPGASNQYRTFSRRPIPRLLTISFNRTDQIRQTYYGIKLNFYR